jgi:hypothetical protein
MNLQNEFNIHLPDLNNVEQGKEYFILEKDRIEEKIEFHDYDRIYEIPGLYEKLFYDTYQCNSPETVCDLLEKHINKGEKKEEIVALDIGAGNGMVGVHLSNMGADTIVGVDIIPEAASALERDRPGLYTDYHVADLTSMSPAVKDSLEKKEFNCMTVVAALGFDDIPPEAFAQGYNLISSPGWVAFNIKEDFVCNQDQTGFCSLIQNLDNEGILDICEQKRYRHRFCQDGTPLYYYAVVGKKMRDIPWDLIST